jgi:hypothetical protein
MNPFYITGNHNTGLLSPEYLLTLLTIVRETGIILLIQLTLFVV